MKEEKQRELLKAWKNNESWVIDMIKKHGKPSVEKYVEFIIDASYSEQKDEIMWLVDNALKGNKKDVWDAITEIDQIK